MDSQRPDSGAEEGSCGSFAQEKNRRWGYLRVEICGGRGLGMGLQARCSSVGV